MGWGNSEVSGVYGQGQQRCRCTAADKQTRSGAPEHTVPHLLGPRLGDHVWKDDVRVRLAGLVVGRARRSQHIVRSGSDGGERAMHQAIEWRFAPLFSARDASDQGRHAEARVGGERKTRPSCTDLGAVVDHNADAAPATRARVVGFEIERLQCGRKLGPAHGGPPLSRHTFFQGQSARDLYTPTGSAFSLLAAREPQGHAAVQASLRASAAPGRRACRP